jgi:hypothetical protein
MAKTSSFLKEEYGLKSDNIFKSRSAKEVDLRAWVDREKEIKQWNKVIETSAKANDSNFLVFIIGGYGMGKTLSLLKIKQQAQKEGLFSIYLNFKSEEKSSKPGLDFIQRIFKGINFENIKIKEKDIEPLFSVFPDAGNVFEKILVRKQTQIWGKTHRDDASRNAIAFLRGEKNPNANELRQLGAVRKITSVDVAKEYLISLLYLIKKAGFPTLAVIIDEFEYLFSIVTSSQQAIYLAVLRALYDLNTAIPKEINDCSNIAFFIASSEDGWRRLSDLEKREGGTGGPIVPLKQRISSTITLKELNKENTKELIEIRLGYNRIEGKYKKTPLIPYTEDFVNYIYKLTLGKPRFILERCDHVLDSGLEKGIPRLTAKFASEVFKERGYSY